MTFQTPSDGTSAHYLVFALYGAKFAVPLLWIREAIEKPDFSAQSPLSHRFSGLLRCGGETIPVIDLRPKLKKHFADNPEANNPLRGFKTDVALSCHIPWGGETIPIALPVDRVQCLLSTDAPEKEFVPMGQKKIPLLAPGDLLTHEESKAAIAISRSSRKAA